ncbi:MAG: hypothetical protein WED07_07770 [Candidatus Freyarchaeum deiterrae]
MEEKSGVVGKLYPGVAEARNAYYERVGWKWNPFAKVRLSDPELFVASTDVILEIDDYIKAKERHLLITSEEPGMGKTMLLELIFNDLILLSKQENKEYLFNPIVVNQSKLFVRQMGEVIAKKLDIKYTSKMSSEDIYTLIKKDIMTRFLLTNWMTLIFIDDFGDNDSEVFIKLKELGDLTQKDANNYLFNQESDFKKYASSANYQLSKDKLNELKKNALDPESRDQMICMLILTGTKSHALGLKTGVPHLYDRCWEIELDRLDRKKVRELIGRRLYWAGGKLASFKEDNFETYPFDEDAISVLTEKAHGVGRDLRLLCNQAVFVAASNLKDGRSERITKEIIESLPPVEKLVD